MKNIQILLNKWTKNLSKRQAVIKIFSKIRDIPYAVISDLKDDPIKMVKINKGYCAPKHMLLVDMLRAIGVKAKFVIIYFRWSRQKQLPNELKKLAKKYADYRGHLAATAFINNKWVLLDATWDQKLKKLGFPINYWDGISSTRPAVKSIGKLKIINKYIPSTKIRTKDSMKFYSKLNEWLEKSRK